MSWIRIHLYVFNPFSTNVPLLYHLKPTIFWEAIQHRKFSGNVWETFITVTSHYCVIASILRLQTYITKHSYIDKNKYKLNQNKFFKNLIKVSFSNFFKVDKGNTQKNCSKLTIKTLEWRQWHYYIFVNFEKILHIVLVALLLTFNIFYTLFWCFQHWPWTSKCRLYYVIFNQHFNYVILVQRKYSFQSVGIFCSRIALMIL